MCEMLYEATENTTYPELTIKREKNLKRKLIQERCVGKQGKVLRKQQPQYMESKKIKCFPRKQKWKLVEERKTSINASPKTTEV